MAKAKHSLQHSTSCTIWLGPKAMGGGFNDRADVQHTCRGMLGDGLKKHSSSLWPGKAAQGQLCGGGRVREPDTCLQQKAGDQSQTLHNGNMSGLSPSKRLFFIQYRSILMFITVLTCGAINNNNSTRVHEVNTTGTAPKY